MALAQHLKEASTVPIATDSVGSRVRWVMRRSSSNICLWNMAASASRAICFAEKPPPKRTVNPLQQQSSPQREQLAGMALVSWHLESRNKVAVSAEFTLPGSNKAHEASSKRRPRSVTVHRSPPTHAFKAELAHG